MIHLIENGVYWKDTNAAIIFNPVSVSNNRIGKNVFNSNLRHEFKDVYEEYLDYIKGVSKKRLLGDVQLVQVDDKKLIMNGFVYWDDQINLKAVTKVLIELSNLSEEYHIPIAISSSMGSKDPEIIEKLNKIIVSIFGDSKEEIYIYKRKLKNKQAT